MRPPRVTIQIARAALACALTVAATIPNVPAATIPAVVTQVGAAADTPTSDPDPPCPPPHVDIAPLMVKPPSHGDGSHHLDGTLPTTAGTPHLDRLTHLRPRSHLPSNRATHLDPRPA